MNRNNHLVIFNIGLIGLPTVMILLFLIICNAPLKFCVLRL